MPRFSNLVPTWDTSSVGSPAACLRWIASCSPSTWRTAMR